MMVECVLRHYRCRISQAGPKSSALQSLSLMIDSERAGQVFLGRMLSKPETSFWESAKEWEE